MKTALTIEQSATLISKGVKYERASEWLNTAFDDSDFEWKMPSPVFTLGDLLSLLPEKITFGHRTNCRLKMQAIISSEDCISEVWQACYLHTSLKANAEASELIDALYGLLLWVIDHNHVELG